MLQVLDATLFEPGPWLPRHTPHAIATHALRTFRAITNTSSSQQPSPESLSEEAELFLPIPSTIPAPTRDPMRTATGLLINELASGLGMGGSTNETTDGAGVESSKSGGDGMGAGVQVVATVAGMLRQALELDGGCFHSSPLAAVMLYCIRLAVRVRGFAFFVLRPCNTENNSEQHESPHLTPPRGLPPIHVVSGGRMNTNGREVECPSVVALRCVVSELDQLLRGEVMKVMRRWGRRARRRQEKEKDRKEKDRKTAGASSFGAPHQGSVGNVSAGQVRAVVHAHRAFLLCHMREEDLYSTQQPAKASCANPQCSSDGARIISALLASQLFLHAHHAPSNRPAWERGGQGMLGAGGESVLGWIAGNTDSERKTWGERLRNLMGSDERSASTSAPTGVCELVDVDLAAGGLGVTAVELEAQWQRQRCLVLRWVEAAPAAMRDWVMETVVCEVALGGAGRGKHKPSTKGRGGIFVNKDNVAGGRHWVPMTMPTRAGAVSEDVTGADKRSEGDDDDSGTHGGTRGGELRQGVAVGVEYAFPGSKETAVYAPPVSVEGRYVLATAHIVEVTEVTSRDRRKGDQDHNTSTGSGSSGAGGGGHEEWDSEEEWEEEESYEQWLRRVTTRLGNQGTVEDGEQQSEEPVSVPSTEVDLQLGALTLNRRRLQPLPPHLSQHPHFTALFSPFSKTDNRRRSRNSSTQASVTSSFQVVEVDLREHCHWLRLVGRRHDLHYWSPHPMPTPIAAALTLSSRSGDSGKRRRWKGGTGPSIAPGERWVAGVLLPVLERLQLGALAENLSLPPLAPNEKKGGLMGWGNGDGLVFGKHEESVGAVEMVVDGVSGAAATAASMVGGAMRGAAARISKGVETVKEKAGRRKAKESKAREEAQTQSPQTEWFQNTAQGENPAGRNAVSLGTRTSCVVLQGEWQGGLKEIVVMEVGKMGMEGMEMGTHNEYDAGDTVVQIFEVEEHGRYAQVNSLFLLLRLLLCFSADAFTADLHIRAAIAFVYTSGETIAALLTPTPALILILLHGALLWLLAALCCHLYHRCRCTNNPHGGKVDLVVGVVEMQGGGGENRNGFRRGW